MIEIFYDKEDYLESQYHRFIICKEVHNIESFAIYKGNCVYACIKNCKRSKINEQWSLLQ